MSTRKKAPTNQGMTKEARRKAILSFLQETDLALPLKAIYVNMEREGATFSERTCRRLVYEMEDEGLIDRAEEPQTFFEITEEGRAYLEDADASHT